MTVERSISREKKEVIMPLFSVKSETITYKIATVKAVDNLTVSFNQFALVWFIKGSAFIGNEANSNFILLSNITNKLFDVTERTFDKSCELTLTEQSFRTLIAWLSARINYCQMERKSNIARISKMYMHETMLDMKQLRIDMSECLIIRDVN